MSGNENQNGSNTHLGIPCKTIEDVQRECLNLASIQLRLRESHQITRTFLQSPSSASANADEEKSRVQFLHLQNVNSSFQRMVTILESITKFAETHVDPDTSAAMFDIVFGTTSRVIMERFDLFTRVVQSQVILEHCMRPIAAILKRMGEEASDDAIRLTGLKRAQAFASLFVFLVNLLSPNTTQDSKASTTVASTLSPSNCGDALVASILQSITGVLNSCAKLASPMLRASLCGSATRLPLAYLISQALGIAERGEYGKSVSLLALQVVNTIRAWLMGELPYDGRKKQTPSLCLTPPSPSLSYLPPKLLSLIPEHVLELALQNKPIPKKYIDLINQCLKSKDNPSGIDYVTNIYMKEVDRVPAIPKNDGSQEDEELSKMSVRYIAEEFDLYLLGLRVLTGFVPGIMSTCAKIVSGDLIKRGSKVVQEVLSLFTLTTLNCVGDLTKSIECIDKNLPKREGQQDDADQGNDQIMEVQQAEEDKQDFNSTPESLQKLFSRVQQVRQEAMQAGHSESTSQVESGVSGIDAHDKPEMLSAFHRPSLPSTQYDIQRSPKWIGETEARIRLLCERIFALLPSDTPMQASSTQGQHFSTSVALDTTLGSFMTTISPENMIASIDTYSVEEAGDAGNQIASTSQSKPGTGRSDSVTDVSRGLIKYVPRGVACSAFLLMAHAQKAISGAAAILLDALLAAASNDSSAELIDGSDEYTLSPRLVSIIAWILGLGLSPKKGFNDSMIISADFDAFFYRTQKNGSTFTITFVNQFQQLFVERLSALPRILATRSVSDTAKNLYLQLLCGYTAFIGYFSSSKLLDRLNIIAQENQATLPSLSKLLTTNISRILPALISSSSVDTSNPSSAFVRARLSATTHLGISELGQDESLWCGSSSSDEHEVSQKQGLEPYYEIKFAFANSDITQISLQSLNRIIGLYLGSDTGTAPLFLKLFMDEYASLCAAEQPSVLSLAAGQFLCDMLLGIRSAAIIDQQMLSNRTSTAYLYEAARLPPLIVDLPPPPPLHALYRDHISLQLLKSISQLRVVWNSAIAPIPVALKARRALSECAPPLITAESQNAMGDVESAEWERDELRRMAETDGVALLGRQRNQLSVVPIVSESHGTSGAFTSKAASSNPLGMRATLRYYFINSLIQCVGLRLLAAATGISKITKTDTSSERVPSPDSVTMALVVPILIDKLGSSSAWVHQAAIASLQRICLHFGYALENIDQAISDHADYLISDLSVKLGRYRTQSQSNHEGNAEHGLYLVMKAIKRVRKARRGAFKAFLAGSALHNHGFILGDKNAFTASKGAMIERDNVGLEQAQQAVLSSLQDWRRQAQKAMRTILTLEQNLEDGLSLARTLRGTLIRSAAATTTLPALRQILIQCLDLLSEHMHRLAVTLPNDLESPLVNKKSTKNKIIRVQRSGHSILPDTNISSDEGIDLEENTSVRAETLHRRDIVLAYLSVVMAAIQAVSRRIDAQLPTPFKINTFNDFFYQGFEAMRNSKQDQAASEGKSSDTNISDSVYNLITKESKPDTLRTAALLGTKKALMLGTLTLSNEQPTPIVITNESKALVDREGSLILSSPPQLQIESIRQKLLKKLEPLEDQKIERERLETMRKNGMNPGEIALEYWRGRQRRLEKRYGLQQDEPEVPPTKKKDIYKRASIRVLGDNSDPDASDKTDEEEEEGRMEAIIGTADEEASRLETARKLARKKERILRRGLLKQIKVNKVLANSSKSKGEDSGDASSESDSDGDDILDSMLEGGGGMDQQKANDLQKQQDEDYDDQEKEIPEEMLLQRVLIQIRAFLTLMDPIAVTEKSLHLGKHAKVASIIQQKSLAVASYAIAALAGAGRARGLLKTAKLAAGVTLTAVTGDSEADKKVRKLMKKSRNSSQKDGSFSYKGEKVSRREKLAAAWGGPGGGSWTFAQEDEAEKLLSALENLAVSESDENIEENADKDAAYDYDCESSDAEGKDETSQVFILPIRWDRHLLPQAAQIWPPLRACLSQPFTTSARATIAKESMKGLIVGSAITMDSRTREENEAQCNVVFTPSYAAALDLLCVLSRNAPKFLGSRIAEEAWPKLERALYECRRQSIYEQTVLGRAPQSNTLYYKIQWAILFTLARISPFTEIVNSIVKSIASAVVPYLSANYINTDLAAMATAIMAELASVDVTIVGTVLRSVEARLANAKRIVEVATAVSRIGDTKVHYSRTSETLDDDEVTRDIEFHGSNLRKLRARKHLKQPGKLSRNNSSKHKKTIGRIDISPVLNEFMHGYLERKALSEKQKMNEAVLQLTNVLTWPPAQGHPSHTERNILTLCHNLCMQSRNRNDEIRDIISRLSTEVNAESNEHDTLKSTIIDSDTIGKSHTNISHLIKALTSHDASALPSIANPFAM